LFISRTPASAEKADPDDLAETERHDGEIIAAQPQHAKAEREPALLHRRDGHDAINLECGTLLDRRKIKAGACRLRCGMGPWSWGIGPGSGVNRVCW
jgi:hypothetical protein